MNSSVLANTESTLTTAAETATVATSVDGAALTPRTLMAATHLVFVPDSHNPGWFLWGSDAAQSPLAVLGEPGVLWLPEATEEGWRLRRARGYRLPMLEGVQQLVTFNQAELQQLPVGVALWSLAAKLGLEMVERQQLVPRVVKEDGQQLARWHMAFNLSADMERLQQLVRACPVSAHALPIVAPQGNERPAPDIAVWRADSLLRRFMDILADHMMRVAQPAPTKRRSHAAPASVAWPLRWQAALLGDDAEFIPTGAQERTVLTDLRDWLQPVMQAQQQAWHLCLQLIAPLAPETVAANTVEFALRIALRREDGERTVTAYQLFTEPEAVRATLACEPAVAQQQLLQQLAVAARSVSHLENELRKRYPDALLLRPRLVCEFLKQMDVLAQSGVFIDVPDELRPGQQHHVQLVMCLGVTDETAQTRGDMAYHWQVRLAGQRLDEVAIDALLELRTPLAYFRGHWVMLDMKELLHAQQMLQQRGGSLSRSMALSMALLGSQRHEASGLLIVVEPQGDLAELVAQMREREAVRDLPDPPGLMATLRPYQRRGFSWLAHVSRLGLGACLADDMGLGKTIQLLTYLLHRQAMNDPRPVLLVCPTSVLGNWQRELARFAPCLAVLNHYGLERHQNAEDFAAAAAGRVVLTSYGLLRRDVEFLHEVPFAVCVLDEAQFIKNSAAATARAARRLKASERIALTGTPVENHLAELWSIMEFLNPGLLGPRETFRREIAIPVERHGREDVAEKLKRMVAPFILRRLKTDTSIINDLPAKQEHKVYCTLTREQAALYGQTVNEALLDIEGVDGMTRRGRVLALLTALKQICNHPAHYLREQGPLNGRSGKLDRLLEMLQKVLANDDRALIFTQYREMGDRLARALTRLQGRAVPFLHGGVSRHARDEMVRRFQEDARASRLLVISLKAGGTGLNLTAATQVYHFDRWWNPAVEDQATDRAYRIGQQRNVQVYKLLCAGTIEDKIDQMLEAKRDLAERVVTQGEAWISELDNQQLRELFALAPDAVVGEAPDLDEDEP